MTDQPDLSMMSAERNAVKRACDQVIAFEKWTREKAEAARANRYQRRRQIDHFKDNNPTPVNECEWSPQTKKHCLKCAKCKEFANARAAYNRERRSAEVDRRGPGREERRNPSFPGPTGEEVIDGVVRSQRRWATLASAALTMAREKRGFIPGLD